MLPDCKLTCRKMLKCVHIALTEQNWSIQFSFGDVNTALYIMSWLHICTVDWRITGQWLQSHLWLFMMFISRINIRTHPIFFMSQCTPMQQFYFCKISGLSCNISKTFLEPTRPRRYQPFSCGLLPSVFQRCGSCSQCCPCLVHRTTGSQLKHTHTPRQTSRRFIFYMITTTCVPSFSSNFSDLKLQRWNATTFKDHWVGTGYPRELIWCNFSTLIS